VRNFSNVLGRECIVKELSTYSISTACNLICVYAFTGPHRVINGNTQEGDRGAAVRALTPPAAIRACIVTRHGMRGRRRMECARPISTKPLFRIISRTSSQCLEIRVSKTGGAGMSSRWRRGKELAHIRGLRRCCVWIRNAWVAQADSLSTTEIGNSRCRRRMNACRVLITSRSSRRFEFIGGLDNELVWDRNTVRGARVANHTSTFSRK
jgi:hypothetical protein